LLSYLKRKWKSYYFIIAHAHRNPSSSHLISSSIRFMHVFSGALANLYLLEAGFLL